MQVLARERGQRQGGGNRVLNWFELTVARVVTPLATPYQTLTCLLRSILSKILVWLSCFLSTLLIQYKDSVQLQEALEQPSILSCHDLCA